MKKVGGKLFGFVFGVGILFALLPGKQAGAQDLKKIKGKDIREPLLSFSFDEKKGNVATNKGYGGAGLNARIEGGTVECGHALCGWSES